MRRFSLASEFSPSRRLFTKRLSAALAGAFAVGPRLFAQNAANAEASETAQSAASKPIFVRKGADPWILEFRGKYVWSQSNNPTRQIVLSIGDTPDKPGRPRPVWTAPEKGPYSRELWAPEIHFIDGRFYIYFAADDGDNKNHLTYVLVSENDDPFSEYRLEGPLYTGDDFEGKTNNRWAIDSTLFEHKGKRYLIWSGWEDDRDIQYLYAAPMKSPTETAGPRVKLCDNADFLWERVEERLGTRGLNEGPEVVVAPNGRTFVSYSCGASWLPTYKVALLEFVGDDPLAPASWRKLDKPFLQSDENLFGVGHGSFVRDANGQTLYFYHAKLDRSPGWNRAVYYRPVEFDADGLPRLK